MTDQPPILFVEKPRRRLDDRPQNRFPGPPPSRHVQAAFMLAAATVFWGVSFPLAKALVIAQRGLLPGVDGWFLVALGLAVRFGLAGVVLAAFSWKTLGSLTRRELWQGTILGGFAGGGMLLQMDGLIYTAASTSAFLTACYCVMIPAFVACRYRRWPSGIVLASCALVVVGMGLLAGIDWRTMRLGRGEWETVLASVFFAGQILWLERPGFARNRTSLVTLIMFGTIALVSLPVMAWHVRAAADIAAAVWGSAFIAGLMLALTLFCTLVSFTMMNHWQRHLEATQAGLIYCAEPVFASGFALCLPGWLAAWGRIVYANETLSWQLLAGGALITAANVAIQKAGK